MQHSVQKFNLEKTQKHTSISARIDFMSSSENDSVASGGLLSSFVSGFVFSAFLSFCEDGISFCLFGYIYSVCSE